MDPVLLLKFMHVSLAILWLGGGMCFILLGAMAGRDAPGDRIVTIARQVAFYAPRVFVPASALVLLSGVALAHLGGWGWPAWVVLGLAGVAFTAGFGAKVLGPLADRAVALADAGDLAGAAALARRMLRLARCDYVVQFAIVFLMVTKLQWADAAALSVLALAVLAGAGTALRPGVPA